VYSNYYVFLQSSQSFLCVQVYDPYWHWHLEIPVLSRIYILFTVSFSHMKGGGNVKEIEAFLTDYRKRTNSEGGEEWTRRKMTWGVSESTMLRVMVVEEWLSIQRNAFCWDIMPREKVISTFYRFYTLHTHTHEALLGTRRRNAFKPLSDSAKKKKTTLLFSTALLLDSYTIPFRAHSRLTLWLKVILS